MNLLILMNLLFSILLVFFSNPLSKGWMLLLLTISTSLSASNMFLNSWFGYILFLIMVGGLLVTFIYMTSIASNEKFKFPNLIMMSILVVTITMLVMLSYYNNLMDTNFTMSSLMMQNQELHFYKKMEMSLAKIFSSPMSHIPVMLMSYLFLTLIMVVKMTDFSKGPIRQK